MEKSKKKSIKLIGLMVLLIVLFVVLIVLTEILGNKYYMSHINAIQFPDNVTVLKTQVSSTNVYGTHILAEEIIETELSEEEVEKIVAASPKGTRIVVFPLFFEDDGSAVMLEWDDYMLDGTAIEGETKEGMNYYLLTEHTPYGTVFW